MYALMCQTCGGMEETCGEMSALLRNVLHNIEQCNILGGAIENMQKNKQSCNIRCVFTAFRKNWKKGHIDISSPS